MAKLKQYLENSWYRWASQDRQTWYAAQFQYWENINIRNMKNWVCLSWWTTKRELDSNTWQIAYCAKWEYMIRVYLWSKTTTLQSSNVPEINAYTLDTTNEIWTSCFVFDDNVWVCWDDIFTYKYNTVPWTTISPTISEWDMLDTDNSFDWTTCTLVYANTMVLIASWNKLWRYLKQTSTISDVINWKLIREFDESKTITALTQEWNYLRIYTTDWVDTYIHYAKWTFDVEDTWLVQTTKHEWMVIESDDCVATDWTNDYCLFRTTDALNAHFVLKKISWYQWIDIRRSETIDWENIFYWNTWVTYPPFINKVICDDWVLFANMWDWIWTFTEYNWWLWWWCIEFKREPWTTIYDIYQYKDFLYASVKDWDDFEEWVYDLRWQPATYQTNWFIVGRVFDWWCAWLFKKNDQATITYNMPEWTSMELSYRYDRSSFWYDKSNFLSIKNLTDTNTCYDIVVPTTPWIQDESVLLKQDWWQILLENGNWIKLEDMLVCPFNKTWNLLEYRVDFNSNTAKTKTPILFEHSLTYYDYMRKYR